MSWIIQHFLGTISANSYVVEYWGLSGRDFWGQFQQTFMSWNVNHFLGEISGDNFSEYLCLENSSIFWGRFLESNSANIYVVEYWASSEEDFWIRIQRIFMSWNIKHFLGRISANIHALEFETCSGVISYLFFSHKINDCEHWEFSGSFPGVLFCIKC